MPKHTDEKSMNITRYIYWDMDTSTESRIPRITEGNALKIIEKFKKMK